MILKTTHRTTYRYPQPVIESHNEVRLMPLSDPYQECKSFGLEVDPSAKIVSHSEPGGFVHSFGIRPPHRILDIVAVSTVETFATDPLAGIDIIDAFSQVEASDEFRGEFAEYLAPTKLVSFDPEVVEMANVVRKSHTGSTVELLQHLNKLVFDCLKYTPNVTNADSLLNEVLQLRAGVCQDFSHLLIALLRVLGIPARYVSGYLFSPADEHLSEDHLFGEQATHAWVEAFVPVEGGRWLGLDPTNNLLANDRYVRVHIGRDYADVAPTKGTYYGVPAESLEVSVKVERIA